MNRIKAVSLTLLVLACALACQAQTGPVGVSDQAHLFSADAIQQAEQILLGLRDQTGWQVDIQTIDALNGQDIQERALASAKKIQVRGLYILISKTDHKFRIVPSPRAETAFPEPKIRAITDALSGGFKQGAFDQGLLDAVAQIKLAAAAEPKPSAKGANTVAVRDQANMFSAETVQQAEQTLREVYLNTGWQVIVQTVESLDGQNINNRALKDAKASQVHGLYFLISKNDRTFRPVPSESAQRVFTLEMTTKLNTALTESFKQGRFDQGLLDAVAQIKTAAAATPSAAAPAFAEPKPAAEAPVAPPAPVVNKGGFPKIGNLGMPEVLILGVGVLALLWILGKVFRRPQPQAMQPGSGYAPAGVPPYEPPSPGPGVRPAGSVGNPGHGYGPQPGYPQQPGNYGPPSQQVGGGAGFMSGVLGGLGGAVVGNILYDKFGRPHPASSQGGERSHAEHGLPGTPPLPPPIPDDPAGPLPPAETYDPDSGGGGDWNEPAPPPEPSTGGDWGDPSSDTGGDWGGGEPSGNNGGGGDWGDDANGGNDSNDGGGGGDWGGDAGGNDGGGGGEW
ncbi:MAG: TPM domain-containing protein [Isosphaeraceae bacterium]